MKHLVLMSILFILISGAFPLQAEEILLSSGGRINAPVLAEREGAVVVDLGFTALSIPREKILSMTSPADPNALVFDASLSPVTENGLYFESASLTPMSLQQCYKSVAPAVVKVSTPAGLGSGFLINSRGFVLTNCHVIEQETHITITLFEEGTNGFEKKIFKTVRIAAINPFLDLALLKIETDGDVVFPYVPLGSSRQVRVGQSCFAVGNPLGLERTLSDGAITTISRAFEGLLYLQTNADINPGNSGGPLFNMSGEVIGITNMGAISFGGLGFAIPIDAVKDFLNHHQAFAYDQDNPNSGYRYLQPDGRVDPADPNWPAIEG
jgi:serine protease Do